MVRMYVQCTPGGFRVEQSLNCFLDQLPGDGSHVTRETGNEDITKTLLTKGGVPVELVGHVRILP